MNIYDYGFNYGSDIGVTSESDDATFFFFF